MPPTPRILLIGQGADEQHLRTAVARAVPRSEVICVPTVFDGIAELSAGQFQTVLASAEPIERRPDAAMKTLRDLAGDARLLLFGHPTLEPLARKMLDFGADDYLIMPVSPGELEEILHSPVYREVEEDEEAKDEIGTLKDAPAPNRAGGPPPSSPILPPSSLSLDLSAVFLDALLDHPSAARPAAVSKLNRLLAPVRVALASRGATPPPAADGYVAFSQPLSTRDDADVLYLQTPRDRDETESRRLLAQLASLFGKLNALQDRTTRLQKLAITDEMTGLSNGRWFRHFLSTIMESSRKRRAPVTLLLFDIDDFKKYNDRYGHGAGDEILKQTAQLMRRSVREHDLVARIGGDEFAVIFWEKEGPRQSRDAHSHHTAPPAVAGKPPQTPLIMCDRFRKLLSQHVFPALGPTGQGSLTISGGLATFPWDGNTPEELIAAADKALMFGAKKSGKNSIALVGE